MLPKAPFRRFAGEIQRIRRDFRSTCTEDRITGMCRASEVIHMIKAIRRALGVLFGALLIANGAWAASVEVEVRSVFETFVRAQNAHDAKALEALLADSPQFLWITRGTTVWGRDAALQRFSKLYEGTWKLDPDYGNLRVTPVGPDAAQLHVPVVFTIGPAGQPPQSVRMFLNQVLVRTGGTWRVMSIFPVPAL
jgi:uncharacterized protein (TIGR02246 family)